MMNDENIVLGIVIVAVMVAIYGLYRRWKNITECY
jgi:hypothetical protein